jgi:hypothetical protein
MRLHNRTLPSLAWLLAAAVLTAILFMPASQAQAHQPGTYHEFELRCSTDGSAVGTHRSVNEGDDFDLQAKWHKNSGTGTWKAEWDTKEDSPVSAEEDVDFAPRHDEEHSKSRLYSTFNHTFHTKEDNRWEGNETYQAGYSAIRPSGGDNRPGHYCNITIVDDDPLKVKSVRLWEAPENGRTFQLGEWIHVVIETTGNLDMSNGGSITLQLRDSEGTVHEREAEFNVWGSIAAPIMFSHQLEAGDPKAETISVAANFTGGSLYGLKDDGTTSSVELTFSGADHLQTADQADGTTTDPTHYGIDARPRVNDISVSSIPPTPHLITDDRGDTWIYIDTYRGGENIELTAKFDQPVRVEGDSGISIRIGSSGNWRGARYASGSGTDTLVYSYTVKAADLDDDGISIDTGGPGSGFFGSGKILSNTGSVEVNPSYTGTRYNHVQKVDGRPIVMSVGIPSDPEEDNTYGKDEKIQISFKFNNEVDVTGTPAVAIDFHYPNEPASYISSRNATYESGSGTNTLIFAYTVTDNDKDEDGISMQLGGGDFGFTGGKISAKGTDVEVSHRYSGFWNEDLHKVNGMTGSIPPKVTGLSVTSDPGSDQHYVAGDEIQVTVQFDEDLTITQPDPTESEVEGIVLTLGIGDRPVLAQYDSDEGTDSQLVFSYTVRNQAEDTDGIEIKANAVKAGTGSTIRDSDGNDAVLTHDAVTAGVGHRVDAVRPTVSQAAMHTFPKANNTYSLGEQIEVKLVFSEDVTVTGSPQLEIDLDGAARTAVYQETAAYREAEEGEVVFAYTVQDGDESTYGVAITANSLDLNGGSIRDAVNNDAIPAHPGSFADNAHLVDDSDKTSPSITGMAFTSTPASGNTYGTGEVIEITVTFDEDITVTGTPQLELFFDGDNGIADYSSASGADMVFNYTVKVGDSASDGLAVFANKLTLNGGTIKDAADNAASLSHAGHGPIQQYVNGAGGV